MRGAQHARILLLLRLEWDVAADLCAIKTSAMGQAGDDLGVGL